MRNVWQSILDLLFPPRCKGCGELLPSAKNLCGTCREKLHPVGENTCLFCGRDREYCSCDFGADLLFERAVSAWYYSDTGRALLHRFKFRGDRAVFDMLPRLSEKNQTISAADIPDLVPILAVAAAAMNGAEFKDIHRLRLKESDRVASVIAMLTALGGKADATEDTLTVFPCTFKGGTVDACNDHRIAMAAAIAATVCTAPVTILGADCVKKSYPGFWEEFNRLGGKYELNLR